MTSIACRRAAWLTVLVLSCSCGPAFAQDDILDKEITRRIFYVECEGSINSRRNFNGARHQVIISHTSAGSANPLSVVMEATPALGAKNSFYFNSDETSMEITSNTLRCRLKDKAVRRSTLHFFYMSPALYRSKLGTTHRDQERIKWIDTHAKPIRITAQDVELSLRIQGNSVNGTIHIYGFDELGHQPVHYMANFQGFEYVYTKPKM